jgi:hypothetical protein
MVLFRMKDTDTNSTSETPGAPYMYMTKSAEASGSYDDGLYIYFGDSKPGHITLEMWTDNPDIETCDLRLTSIDPNTS